MRKIFNFLKTSSLYRRGIEASIFGISALRAVILAITGGMILTFSIFILFTILELTVFKNNKNVKCYEFKTNKIKHKTFKFKRKNNGCYMYP